MGCEYPRHIHMRVYSLLLAAADPGDSLDVFYRQMQRQYPQANVLMPFEQLPPHVPNAIHIFPGPGSTFPAPQPAPPPLTPSLPHASAQECTPFMPGFLLPGELCAPCLSVHRMELRGRGRAKYCALPAVAPNLPRLRATLCCSHTIAGKERKR